METFIGILPLMSFEYKHINQQELLLDYTRQSHITLHFNHTLKSCSSNAEGL